MTSFKIKHYPFTYRNEKTIITLTDIENGFKLFLNNDEVKNRKKHKELQNDIKFSMYN